jgi:hypothetical protein
MSQRNETNKTYNYQKYSLIVIGFIIALLLKYLAQFQKLLWLYL